MKKITSFVILYLCFWGILHAQNALLPTQSPNQPPLHETRAVWLTTIGGIDWPHSYSQSPSSAMKQQQEFCDILDKLCHAGINTVLIQTRIRATTIFQSDMEPWDGCLSGFPGKSPGYDGLAFCIDECHKRGMKLHAWVVTIPVGRWNGSGCKHLRTTCPGLLKHIGDEGFMNPDNHGTATYLATFCKDLASRYDIDGIHLDYCRYPDTWGVIKDKVQGRENITRIVRSISNAVRSVKPWMQMSCSPVGKYADTKRQWAHGWNARDVVCQDVALWLKEGYMDAIYPMMYFKDENFYPFAIDWQERSSVSGSLNPSSSNSAIVAPGLGIYFMDPSQKNWPLSDITREFYVLRQYRMGNCMFRSKFFTDNTKGVYDFYANAFAPLPSLQPAMTWLSNKAPLPPTNLYVKQIGKNTTIMWNGNALLYNLYGSDTYPVDVTKAENLLAGNLQRTAIDLGKTGHTTYFAVTATDRYGNESEAIQSFGRGDISSHSIVRGGSTTSLSHVSPQPYREVVFPTNKCIVYLNGTDLKEGDLVIISSIMGNELTSAFVKSAGNSLYINTGNLLAGHYILHSINRKGKRHHLGRFDIPLK